MHKEHFLFRKRQNTYAAQRDEVRTAKVLGYVISDLLVQICLHTRAAQSPTCTSGCLQHKGCVIRAGEVRSARITCRECPPSGSLSAVPEESFGGSPLVCYTCTFVRHYRCGHALCCCTRHFAAPSLRRVREESGKYDCFQSTDSERPLTSLPQYRPRSRTPKL